MNNRTIKCSDITASVKVCMWSTFSKLFAKFALINCCRLSGQIALEYFSCSEGAASEIESFTTRRDENIFLRLCKNMKVGETAAR